MAGARSGQVSEKKGSALARHVAAGSLAEIMNRQTHRHGAITYAALSPCASRGKSASASRATGDLARILTSTYYVSGWLN